MLRNTFSSLVLAGGLALAAGSAVPARAADTGPIKIGLNAAIQLQVGRDIVDAATLAVNEINAKGGVLGRKLELVVADETVDPQQGVAAINKLTSDDHVNVLIGGYSSGVQLAQLPHIARSKTVFLDVGSLFSVRPPLLQDFPNGVQRTDADGNLLFEQLGTDANGDPIVELVTSPTAPDGSANTRSVIQGTFFKEVFVGDSPSPRISVGVGVNWNSPFGPFRIDLSHVLKKQVGDDTKLFSFNVGTQF